MEKTKRQIENYRSLRLLQWIVIHRWDDTGIKKIESGE